MADLLLELFSEEIPAGLQARAAEDLQRLVSQALTDRGLSFKAAAAFATPRRLALSITGMPRATRARREERKGPRVDAPEKALEGFLRSTGLTREQLVRRADKKGEVWFAEIRRPGRPAPDVIAEAIPEVIRAFPWPRSMRWGAGELSWIRPLRSILCILTGDGGEGVVPFSVGHLTSGAETRGHRFMAPEVIRPKDFEDYAARLLKAKVVLDPAARRARISADMSNMAFAAGMEIVEDEGLLAEVAGLVEWPVVLMGEIEERFLTLPPEVLQTSMKEHQKFFSLRNPKTGRIERFVTVANIETADQGATILAGNQRVLAARLSDALFFWENDLRTIRTGGMEAMGAPLKDVTFHNKLGSQADRIARIAALAREIAPLVGADADKAERAAKIAKADLCSEMVNEFPELQGVMGRYYAEAAGEAPDVAAACQAHYAPLGPSDAVPTEPVSVAVALADKIDVLTGFWAIDERPTGSKDPFALRRAALGVIRIILENRLRIRLDDSGGPLNVATIMLTTALHLSLDGMVGKRRDLLTFFADRLKVHLRAEGVRHDVIDACFQLGGQDDLVLLVNRVKALQAFVDTEDGANLLAGYKRAANILAAEQKKDGVEYTLDPDPKFAEGDEERALFAALDAADATIRPALAAEDFAAAMAAMAGLRGPIDAFFDKTQVNAENQIVRRNRLCLLNRVKVVMERVAVFSAIEG
ncbi:glycine--tRNA ligase subunit beta [Pikeienuella sp. HZG-20]|uniref:glycine--tRNA ligase subunit beta n=1 Tax=Paludibacillus litoralis TaxID=3133267 RepID=UPI0030EE721D